MNNKNVRNTKNQNKFVKLVIGLSIGLILLTGTTFVLAREMPKYDKNLNTWDKIIYSLKGGWEAVFNPGVKHNSQYKRVEEKKEYNNRFNKFEKNSKYIQFDGLDGKNPNRTWGELLNSDGTLKLNSIGYDKYLSKTQNNKIDKSFAQQYNKWLKKNPRPSNSMAEYMAMKFLSKSYDDVLGPNNKRAKDLKKTMAQIKAETEKANKKQDKTDSDNSEPSTLGGKIAKALLNMFYSDGIKAWLQNSGPGATIFSTNYIQGESGIQTFHRIAKSYNENVFNEIFAPAAYTRSMATIGEKLTPIFISLSAVLIVLIVVMQAGKMGFGQAFNPIQSRTEWYHNLIDTAIAVVGCCHYGLLVQLILTVNGAMVVGLAGLMAGTTTASGHTIMNEALTLGFNSKTIDMLTSGSFFGSEFSGIIFAIVYLLTYIGLAVYLKYYYFVREISFIILFALGPVFIAFWPTHWGKYRTVGWLKEMCGTVFIQSIHALTMTFMATLMAWNNENFARFSNDTSVLSPTQSAGKTLGSIPGKLSKFDLLGSAYSLAKGSLQLVGINPETSVKQSAMHFETIVIGFIVLILFQPISKSLASLFGIETNILDNIHQSTSNTLQSAALVAGGAIIGGAALGASVLGTGGLTAASGAKALGEATNAAKLANKGKKFIAFKKAFSNSFNKDNKLNKLRSAAAKTTARLNGIVGKSAGALAMQALGVGANANPATLIALTRAGGEIGDRAANLAAGQLSKLGLKKADPNRKQKMALKDQLNNITDTATYKSTQSSIDNAANLNEQIKKAKADPNLSSDEQKQKAIQQAEENVDFSNSAGLDISQAAEAKAKRLTNGKNNYKNAKDINDALRNQIEADSNMSEQQKAEMIQASDKAMIKAGVSAYDPKIMFDNVGYADAQKANDLAKANKLSEIKQQFNTGNIPGAPTPDQMSFEEWQNSNQYQEKFVPQINEAGRLAAQKVLNASNGHIYGKVDDKLFQNGIMHDSSAIINADIYKKELSSSLQSMGFQSSDANKYTEIADGFDGISLVQEVPELSQNGSPARILDSGLWHKLNSQTANTINATWGGLPKITADSLENLYNDAGYNVYGGLIGNNTEMPAAQDFSSFVNQQDQAAYLAEGHRNWAEFRNMSAITAKKYDSTNPLTWFSNPNQFQWEKSHPEFKNDFNSSTAYGNRINDSIAQDRISNNPDLQPDICGMSLDNAYMMLPKTSNGSSIKPGAFRMQIQNTHSMLQAADSDGNWFSVGNIGRGDGTLEAGQTVYQDLDLSSNGTPSLHYDSASHSISAPYTLDGTRRIPATLSNGIPELTSFFNNPKFANSTITNTGDFLHMPKSYILNRSQAFDTNPTLDQYSNYADFALQGNNSSYIITGINKSTGQREVLTSLFENSPELGSMPSNTSYYIPLINNGETGLDISKTGDSHIYFNGNVKQSDKKLANQVFSSFLSDEPRINHVNSYLHESILPYTKSYLRNFIANNPANLSGLNLDTFYKNLY